MIVYAGGISPKGEYLLKRYLDKFAPNATIEPLKNVGIKGKMRNYGNRPDVMLIIIEESLYQVCVGFVDNVLQLPKVHKYTTDDALERFLIERLGVLDEESSAPSSILESSRVNADETDSMVVPFEHVKTADKEMQKLRDQLDQSELLISNLTSQLEEAKSGEGVSLFVQRIKSLEADLEIRNSELASLKNENFSLEEKGNKISDLQISIDELQKEINEEKKKSSALKFEQNKLISGNEVLTEQLKSLQLELETELESNRSLKSELKVLKDGAEDSDILKEQIQSMSGLQDEVTELTSVLSDVQLALENKTVDVEFLESKLKEKEVSIDALRLEIDSQKELFEGKIEKYCLDISTLNEEIRNLQDELDQLKEDSVSAKSFNDLRIEKEDLSESLQVAEQEKELLSQKYEETLESLLNSDVKVEKLTNEILSFQAELEEVRKGELLVKSLNEELLAERRKTTQLNSRLEKLEYAERELLVTTEKLKNVEQRDVSSDEILRLRKRNAELEVQSLEQLETITDFSNGVFGQLANIALPKVICEAYVSVPSQKLDNFYCIASGSTESSASVYSVLRRSCDQLNKRVLIVDLVTDSMIDSSFGVSQIKSPIDWITGADESINAYVAQTKLSNVRVVSTGFSYLNDLSLLNIDWESRLNSLQKGYNADIILINVGCIVNVVSKVLFNSFRTCMNSHLIVKATPINLRTVILHLAGFKNRDNLTISCVDFDKATSAQFYQKLATKYNSQILDKGKIQF